LAQNCEHIEKSNKESTMSANSYKPLMARKNRPGPYFQMQDVLLAAGELSKRERVAIAWLIDQANELHDAYEKDRREMHERNISANPNV
jgi:hypothetical protein